VQHGAEAHLEAAMRADEASIGGNHAAHSWWLDVLADIRIFQSSIGGTELRPSGQAQRAASENTYLS
jgi:hypothetical protein